MQRKKVSHLMSTTNPRVVITLPLEIYLQLVEHAAVGGKSMSKEGRSLIEQALNFRGKPDYSSVSLLDDRDNS
jgi:hypothetical protein